MSSVSFKRTDTHFSTSSYRKSTCSSFSGRKLAISAFTVIPHIFKNIGLGALKGMELGACKPTELFVNKAKGIGTRGGKINKLCLGAALVAGYTFGAILTIPGLLVGGVVGLGRSLYKLPKAMQASWNSGCSAALRLSDNFYHVNKHKIATVLSIGSVFLAASVIGLAGSVGLTVGLLILTSPLLLAGFYTLHSSLDALAPEYRYSM